ncbi:hypothetical protein AB0M79_29270 [Polymorphospora sp. NPDC051019]|uniref:hypothetical protein n=1 Tax=Polymorphospora sp. NPDC051019 TaxID=3155725 RepID=UPI0034437BF8
MTATAYPHQGITLDQQVAPHTAATRLAGLDPVDVRPIRDETERRVRRLPDELNVPATRQPICPTIRDRNTRGEADR